MGKNGNDITEKMLLIKQQLEPFTKMANQAAKKIKEEGVSNYPIFVAHQDQLEIGIPLLNRVEAGTFWSINASTLEEFYTKKLILDEKLEDFKKLYKEHKGDICFFVVSELGAQYLFIPVKNLDQ
ncbi:MAG TPA: hypothetical protein ENI82_02405 [Bacteroidetes bacterium]|nr:hypothetical protein [Bacteroidota bacterium]